MNKTWKMKTKQIHVNGFNECLIDKIYCYTQNIKNKCNKPACAIINHEEKLQKKNDESFTTR